MKKEQNRTITPIKGNKEPQEQHNEIPMKKEVQVEEAGQGHPQQPAKIIFITSGFGQIHVRNTSTSPMAVAA
ncbi:hypothetical protein KUV80_07580 [Fictibacillus nanhaiensis]|uniref:hypothetical protein n=1 Tax=Fictibacillus nanhaiensis TaxID=742169 RepID=UPI001C983DAC|nr:hypothetical protein [Fictibacillus nanhaiensis]MBY6036507.1 hypothetical protein [Fictibacillus nanhaiensis]